MFIFQTGNCRNDAYLTEILCQVPLPGNWDDNPDKFLLELGGVYSTADRREIFRRDEEGTK